MKNFLCLFVLLLLFHSQCFSAELGDLINGEFNQNSRVERLEIAKDLSKSIDKIFQFVPKLSPSQKEWLKTERVEIYKLPRKAQDQRMINLSESAEFQIEKLYTLLEKVDQCLKSIQNSNIKLKNEIYLWSVVSLELTDTDTINESVEILISKGKLPKNLIEITGLVDSYKGPSLFYSWYGRGIHEYIIIKYLAGYITQ